MLEHLDWITQTAITFTSQINLRCKLISCTFQLTLKFNQGRCNQVQYRGLLPATNYAPMNCVYCECIENSRVTSSIYRPPYW